MMHASIGLDEVEKIKVLTALFDDFLLRGWFAEADIIRSLVNLDLSQAWLHYARSGYNLNAKYLPSIVRDNIKTPVELAEDYKHIFLVHTYPKQKRWSEPEKLDELRRIFDAFLLNGFFAEADLIKHLVNLDSSRAWENYSRGTKSLPDDFIPYLLRNNIITINLLSTHDGFPPLHHAIGYIRFIKQLQHSLSLNQLTGRNVRERVETLIKHKANVRLIYPSGTGFYPENMRPYCSPLRIACIYLDLKIVKLLIQNGALSFPEASPAPTQEGVAPSYLLADLIFNLCNKENNILDYTKKRNHDFINLIADYFLPHMTNSDISKCLGLLLQDIACRVDVKNFNRFAALLMTLNPERKDVFKMLPRRFSDDPNKMETDIELLLPSAQLFLFLRNSKRTLSKLLPGIQPLVLLNQEKNIRRFTTLRLVMSQIMNIDHFTMKASPVVLQLFADPYRDLLLNIRMFIWNYLEAIKSVTPEIKQLSFAEQREIYFFLLGKTIPEKIAQPPLFKTKSIIQKPPIPSIELTLTRHPVTSTKMEKTSGMVRAISIFGHSGINFDNKKRKAAGDVNTKNDTKKIKAVP